MCVIARVIDVIPGPIMQRISQTMISGEQLISNISKDCHNIFSVNSQTVNSKT